MIDQMERAAKQFDTVEMKKATLLFKESLKQLQSTDPVGN